MSTTIRLKANKNGTFYYNDFASSHSDSSVFMSEDLPDWLDVDPLDNTLKGIPRDLGQHQFTIQKKTLDNFKLESTIPGEVSGDDFGTAVSMNKNGTVMAIGGSGRDVGPWEGYVRVFQHIEIEQSVWDGSNTSSSRSIDGIPILISHGDSSPVPGKKYWMQMGQDIDASSPGDNFGYIFKLSNDGYTVVLSSYSNGGNDQGTGGVVVYQYDGEQWVQIGSRIEAMAADYEAGVSLATNAHGNVICIGSYDSNEGDSFSGHVRIFKFNDGEWIQMGENLACEEKGHESGYSITMNDEGTRVAIATYKSNNEDGSIYVYNWDGNQWSQLGGNLYLDKSWNYTIYSIAMNDDGSILSIGAYGDDGIWRGYVRVYQYRTVTSEEWDAKWIHKVPDIITNGDLHHNKESKYWIQLGNDIICESLDDDFEYSVTMNKDGSRLASAIYTSRDRVSCGKIKIYKFVRNQWIQMGETIKIDSVYDNFDKTVSMNSDGTKIMFGSFDDDNTGNISVFSLIDDSDPHEYNIVLEVEEELEEISRLDSEELKELEIPDNELEDGNSSDAESMGESDEDSSEKSEAEETEEVEAEETEEVEAEETEEVEVEEVKAEVEEVEQAQEVEAEVEEVEQAQEVEAEGQIELEYDSEESSSDVEPIEVIDAVIFNEKELSSDNESELEEVQIDKSLIDDSLTENITSNSIIDELESFVEANEKEIQEGVNEGDSPVEEVNEGDSPVEEVNEGDSPVEEVNEGDSPVEEVNEGDSTVEADPEVEREDQKEAAQREAEREAQKEAAQREAEREAQKEAAQREAAQREAAQREAQKEAAQKEATQKEAAQREAAQREAQRQAKQEAEKKKAMEALRNAELQQQRLQAQRRAGRRGGSFGMTMKYTKDNKELHEKELHTRNMLHK